MKSNFGKLKRSFRRRFFNPANALRGESGFTLVEVLAAIAIVGIAAAILIGGQITSSKILLEANNDETARDYAQAQMEYIQGQPYDNNTPPNYAIIAYPIGYEIMYEPEHVPSDNATDTGIQKITVIVKQGPDTLFTLQGYKANIDVK